MSGVEPRAWLDIWVDAEGPAHARRAPLERSLTRIGGADADVSLPAAGADQLHVWNRPPRVLFVGRGPKPTCGGAAFDERELAPGERVLWAGHTLLLGAEGTPEAPAAAPRAETPASASGSGARPGARARAGRRQAQASSVGLGGFLVMQVASFLLFSLLVAAILVVLRIKGLSLDRLIDRLLERVLPG